MKRKSKFSNDSGLHENKTEFFFPGSPAGQRQNWLAKSTCHRFSQHFWIQFYFCDRKNVFTNFSTTRPH